MSKVQRGQAKSDWYNEQQRAANERDRKRRRKGRPAPEVKDAKRPSLSVRKASEMNTRQDIAQAIADNFNHHAQKRREREEAEQRKQDRPRVTLADLKAAQADRLAEDRSPEEEGGGDDA